MVQIRQLVEALQRTLWRQGFVRPEALKHTTDEGGNHHFELTIPKSDCENEAPATMRSEDRLRVEHSSVNRVKPKEER